MNALVIFNKETNIVKEISIYSDSSEMQDTIQRFTENGIYNIITDDYLTLKVVPDLAIGESINEINKSTGERIVPRVEKTIDTEILKPDPIVCRQFEYSQQLDSVRLELLDSVLLSLSLGEELSEEQKKQIRYLIDKRAEIKAKYPIEN